LAQLNAHPHIGIFTGIVWGHLPVAWSSNDRSDAALVQEQWGQT
jgi:hypothetical protein